MHHIGFEEDVVGLSGLEGHSASWKLRPLSGQRLNRHTAGHTSPDRITETGSSFHPFLPRGFDTGRWEERRESSRSCGVVGQGGWSREERKTNEPNWIFNVRKSSKKLPDSSCQKSIVPEIKFSSQVFERKFERGVQFPGFLRGVVRSVRLRP